MGSRVLVPGRVGCRAGGDVMPGPAENAATVREARIAANTLANNAHRCTTPDLTPVEATELESLIYAALDALLAKAETAEAERDAALDREAGTQDALDSMRDGIRPGSVTWRER